MASFKKNILASALVWLPSMFAVAAWPLAQAAPAQTENNSLESAPDLRPDISAGTTQSSEGRSIDQFQHDFAKLPTYVKADTLTLKTEERVFNYTGNVEVKQGDMTLTSNSLEGKYNEHNQIQSLRAQGNVVITKGENIRATSELAVYDATKDIITLTESPELQHDDTILTADAVKIFLKENRSTAEGTVRVKMVKKEGRNIKGPSDLFGGRK